MWDKAARTTLFGKWGVRQRGTIARWWIAGISSALKLSMPNGSSVSQSEVPPRPDLPLRIDELKRQLGENEAQRTEVTGHINQLSIQLHRWQLRLQTLSGRKEELERELGALK